MRQFHRLCSVFVCPTQLDRGEYMHIGIYTNVIRGIMYVCTYVYILYKMDIFRHSR